MQDDKPARQSLKNRVLYTLLEAGASVAGGLLFFVCCYWFFHYETWLERFVAIGLSILVVWLIVKILPDRPD